MRRPVQNMRLRHFANTKPVAPFGSAFRGFYDVTLLAVQGMTRFPKMRRKRVGASGDWGIGRGKSGTQRQARTGRMLSSPDEMKNSGG